VHFHCYACVREGALPLAVTNVSNNRTLVHCRASIFCALRPQRSTHWIFSGDDTTWISTSISTEPRSAVVRERFCSRKLVSCTSSNGQFSSSRYIGSQRSASSKSISLASPPLTPSLPPSLPRGVTRQGVVLTDLQSFLDCQESFSPSLPPSVSHPSFFSLMPLSRRPQKGEEKWQIVTW